MVDILGGIIFFGREEFRIQLGILGVLRGKMFPRHRRLHPLQDRLRRSEG
jgi:hypothetical protein